MHELETTERTHEDLEEYQRLLVRDPDSLRFAEYADLLRRAGRLDDASTICQHGLTRHPAYSTGHVVMGDILSDARRPAEAEDEWQEALRLDPGHPRAHYRLGELHLSRGEREQAITEIEMALLYSQDFPEARAKLLELKGTSELVSAQSRDPRARGGRIPGQRPTWLTQEHLPALLSRASDLPSAEAAGLYDSAGVLLEGEPVRCSAAPEEEPAVKFLSDVRVLLFRLGAGRLRSALICGEQLNLRCLPLGDLTLVVQLGARSIDASDDQLEHVLLQEQPERHEGDGDE